MRKVWVILAALVCCVNMVLASPVTINISGAVTKTGGAAVEGATVTLAKIKGISATTDTQGKFIMSGTVKALQLNSPKAAPIDFMVKGNAMVFSAALGKIGGSVEIFAGNGRKTASIKFTGHELGKSISLPEFVPGLNILRVSIGSEVYTCPIIRLGNEIYVKTEIASISNEVNFKLAKQAATTVSDTLIAKKTGFTDKKTAITSYSTANVAIVMDTVVTANCKPITVPAFSALTDIKELPDPFKMMDGTRITTKSQWACRRAEISALAQAFIYGPKPPKPEKVEATYSSGTLKITCTQGGKSANFSVSISGNSGAGPMPALVCIDGGSVMGVPTGAAKISYSVDNVAKGGMNGRGTPSGIFYTLYPNSTKTGALMAWAWGASRIVDALELTQDQTKINPKRLCMTGCSYAGKAAFCCGAFDERFALVFPMESGSGGCSTWRLSELTNHKGSSENGCQWAAEIYTEAPWMGADFGQFGDKVNKLPIDQHECLALVAPRGMWINEGSKNAWNCPTSNWHSGNACHMVYEALGYPDNMGITMSDHSHCGTAFQLNEKTIAAAFFDKFLFDKKTDTSPTTVIKNDQSLTIDKTKWIPWSVPTLEGDYPVATLDKE
jgi:hypothetical protein